MVTGKVTQEVDEEETKNELDEADMGAFDREHEEEEEMEEAEHNQVQIVTSRGKTSGLPVTADVEAEVILTVVQYQSIIRDYKDNRRMRVIGKL
jgi:hypothetical protein